jgi:DNA repair protein RadC
MHEGHRERLRERAIANGLESLQPHELLELFLFNFIPRKDTNAIAHELIDSFGSISQVLDAKIEDLLTIANMTRRAALALHSLPVIVKMYENDKNKPLKVLSTREAAINYMISEAKYLTKEQLYILCLDTNYKLMNDIILKSDSIDSVNVSIIDVTKAAMRTGCKKIILAHNHPSGSLLPSDDDVELTYEIIDALSYMEVEVLDHLIIAGDKYFSFEERGMLKRELRTGGSKRRAAEKDGYK